MEAKEKDREKESTLELATKSGAGKTDVERYISEKGELVMCGRSCNVWDRNDVKASGAFLGLSFDLHLSSFR